MRIAAETEAADTSLASFKRESALLESAPNIAKLKRVPDYYLQQPKQHLTIATLLVPLATLTTCMTMAVAADAHTAYHDSEELASCRVDKTLDALIVR